MRSGEPVQAFGEVARSAELRQVTHVAITLAVVGSAILLLHLQWAEMKHFESFAMFVAVRLLIG